jgi:hypothetical protein
MAWSSRWLGVRDGVEFEMAWNSKWGEHETRRRFSA